MIGRARRGSVLRRVTLGVGLGLALGGLALAAPERNRVGAEDVAHFVAALERSKAGEESARLAADYLAHASAGLQLFARDRIDGAAGLFAAAAGARRYYSHLRDLDPAIEGARVATAEALAKLATLYPSLPPIEVDFVIGGLSDKSARATQPDGRVIIAVAVDYFGADTGAPLEELPAELAARLDSPADLPVYALRSAALAAQTASDGARGAVGPPTLLDDALIEGAADALAELAAGRRPDAARLAPLESLARPYWRRFLAARKNSDFGNWTLAPGRVPPPPLTNEAAFDLARIYGYHLAMAYYRAARDKMAAIGQLVRLEDSEAILAAANYDPELKTLSGP